MNSSFRSRRVGQWSRGWLSFLAVAVVAGAALSEERKERAYALSAPPLEIYDRLARLELGEVPRMLDDERQLLAKTWALRSKQDAQPDDALLLEAMLLASGSEEASARRKYREQFDALLAKARTATKGAKNDRDRGEQLMKLLHASAMSKGYQSEQTSLSAVFDSGQFNCVSASAMYYLVGSRLGLKLRPISIPGSGFLAGHASLDLIDGKQRLEVEPTNPDGFDWQAKIKRPGVIVLGYVPDRKDGHEVDALGVAAMIYSNRGVALAGDKPPQQLDAARCYLAALALDPVDETAANNLLALFVNWGLELTQEEKFEEALRVLAFGLTISPKFEALDNNHRLAWTKYIEATLEAERDKDAQAIIARAARAIPDDEDFRSASQWFGRHGDSRIKKRDWEAGLAVVGRGLKVLSEDERKMLLDWRSDVFRRWSQSLLEGKDAEASLKVLVRAYALDPSDKEIVEGIAFHTQEALQLLEARSQTAMIEHFQSLRKQFPEVQEVSEAGVACAARAINKFTDDKKFKEAVEAVRQYEPFFATPEQRAEVGAGAFDRWARHLAANKQWKAALDKYQEGLKAFPKNDLLEGNAIATVDEWAKPAIRDKKWDEALEIYRSGLEYFPDDSHLQDNLRYCERMKEKPE